MKKSISRIIGLIMLIIAIVFIMFALNHPEKSFPWNNTITWLLYGVYFFVIVVLLIAPKMKKWEISVYWKVAENEKSEFNAWKNENLRRKIVMALFLLITYIVILIFQIILFVISIRKKTKKLWRILFSAELVPLLISIGLMIYYNDLPGYGFMPGLTYLGEILFSLGAVVLYCISFLISICSYIAISNKQT